MIKRKTQRKGNNQVKNWKSTNYPYPSVIDIALWCIFEYIALIELLKPLLKFRHGDIAGTRVCGTWCWCWCWWWCCCCCWCDCWWWLTCPWSAIPKLGEQTLDTSSLICPSSPTWPTSADSETPVGFGEVRVIRPPILSKKNIHK